MSVRFTCNLAAASASPLLHAWEHTVGSGHATLALRADFQQQLTRCRRELGFRHVRFHGLLCDDMGTLVREEDALVYSFFNVDQIFDFLLSIDMRPFVELSFMPSALASGADLVFHYRGNITPPADYEAWGTLIRKLTIHLVERYGASEVRQWFFEVWNEPNLRTFWTGTQEDYFKLYAAAARAIKSVDSALRVGGPATAKNGWIGDFVAYGEKSSLPIDFVSTHHYPTDAFGKPGDHTVAELAASKRSILRDEATTARASAKGKPLYYTEWGTSSNPFDKLHDEPYAAAFIVKTVLEARDLIEGYSYWTFSDIFEENYFSSKPFHGGFGLLTIDGIPKPAYRAFELLHRLGDQIFEVVGSHETVDAWVTKKDRCITILIANSALPLHPITTENVAVLLQGVTRIESVFLERIDDDHANAKRAWLEMGKPESLLPRQVAALQVASALRPVPVSYRLDHEGTTFEIDVPPQGTVLLTILTS